MNKKMIVAMAITQVILIGSLLAIASYNDQLNTNDDDISNVCLGECDSCDSSCDGAGYCKDQGNENCYGSGTCSQDQKQSSSCTSIYDESGSCRQKLKQTRSCSTTSSCSGICPN